MNTSPEQDQPHDVTRMRIFAGCLAVTAALILILLCNVLPLNARLARFLVDRQVESGDINLFAAQNLMWIAFFWGLAELVVRYHLSSKMKVELEYNMLPTDDDTILIKGDIPRLHAEVRKRGGCGILANLIHMLGMQFQTTEDISMTLDILNAEIELRQNEIDLSYNMVRYIAWVIPTLGFIGTVWGILEALSVASSMSPSDPQLLPAVISALSVAFWTTLLALLMACVLMFAQHIIQNREESLLNSCAQYCLNHFINRLYVKK